MKATDLLKKQHDEVRNLFQRLEHVSDPEDESELFEELATNLVAHDLIEQEIFYPACEEEAGMIDLVGQSLAEHQVMEFALYRADEAQGQDGFQYKCTVLKEIVSHHLKEEESEIFPKVEKELGQDRSEEIATDLLDRFEEAKMDDFRGALHENLEASVSGLMQASSGGRPRGKRRAAKSGSPKNA